MSTNFFCNGSDISNLFLTSTSLSNYVDKSSDVNIGGSKNFTTNCKIGGKDLIRSQYHYENVYDDTGPGQPFYTSENIGKTNMYSYICPNIKNDSCITSKTYNGFNTAVITLTPIYNISNTEQDHCIILSVNSTSTNFININARNNDYFNQNGKINDNFGFYMMVIQP